MNQSTTLRCVRSLVVAGLIGGTAATALGSAHAAPAPRTANASVTAGCRTYFPSPYEVCGEIKDFYNSLGATTSTLSYPNGPEITDTDGTKHSPFLHGTIYWTPTTGAYIG